MESYAKFIQPGHIKKINELAFKTNHYLPEVCLALSPLDTYIPS